MQRCTKSTIWVKLNCDWDTIASTFFHSEAWPSEPWAWSSDSYPNPIGMNFEEALKSEETRKGCVHVVENLSKQLRLLVVL